MGLEFGAPYQTKAYTGRECHHVDMTFLEIRATARFQHTTLAGDLAGSART